MRQDQATVLQCAAELITERKLAALGDDVSEIGMGHVDVERHLGLVASTWDVDASEVNRLASQVALQFLIYGASTGAPLATIVRSAWLDGFCLGLAHAHVAAGRDRGTDAEA